MLLSPLSMYYSFVRELGKSGGRRGWITFSSILRILWSHFGPPKVAYCLLLSIFSVYIAYYVWLFQNTLVFSFSRCTTGVIVERARAHIEKFQMVTAVSTDTWGSGFAPRASQSIFIIWEPPHPRYVKANFDGSMRGTDGRAGLLSMDLA